MRGTNRALKRYGAAEGNRTVVTIVVATGVVLVLLLLFALIANW